MKGGISGVAVGEPAAGLVGGRSACCGLVEVGCGSNAVGVSAAGDAGGVAWDGADVVGLGEGAAGLSSKTSGSSQADRSTIKQTTSAAHRFFISPLSLFARKDRVAGEPVVAPGSSPPPRRPATGSPPRVASMIPEAGTNAQFTYRLLLAARERHHPKEATAHFQSFAGLSDDARDPANPLIYPLFSPIMERE